MLFPPPLLFPFSSPEPMILLACDRDRDLWRTRFSEHMRRVFISNSQPIRFARFHGKPVNCGLPVLDQTRALDACHRPEGSWALGMRMFCFTLLLQWVKVKFFFLSPPLILISQPLVHLDSRSLQTYYPCQQEDNDSKV